MRWPPLWLLGLPLCASVALAHPTDMIVQAAYLTLAPTRANLELDLTPGELVAPRFAALLDANNDERITSAELSSFTARLLERVSLKLGGQHLALRLENSVIPSVAQLRTGGTQLQLRFSADIPNAGGSNTLEFQNTYRPISSAYLANVFVESSAVKITAQRRDITQQRYTVQYNLESRAAVWNLWLIAPIVLMISGVAWWLRRGRKGGQHEPLSA